MASTAAERARRSAARTADPTASALHEAIFREPAPEPAEAPPPDPRLARPPTVRDVDAPGRGSTVKRVRRTVDLPRKLHRDLKRWQDETADMLGVVEVTGQDLGEAMYGVLLTDEEVARKVRAELRRLLAGRR